MCAAAEAGKNQ